jgi:DNA-binding NarL/FixJ family response regulator
VAAQVSSWMLDETRVPRLLTPRETDVLKYLSRGMTNQAIGKELGISEKTVEKYLDSIFKKLGVTSRVKAAVLAIREGIIR